MPITMMAARISLPPRDSPRCLHHPARMLIFGLRRRGSRELPRLDCVKIDVGSREARRRGDTREKKCNETLPYVRHRTRKKEDSRDKIGRGV